MKKITFLIALLVGSLSSIAQITMLSKARFANGSVAPANVVRHSSVNRVMFAPFYIEDFSAGIPAGWSNVDSSGNNITWVWTTTGATGSYTGIDSYLNENGTSAANGYIKLDSDSAGNGSSEDAVLTSRQINCTGHDTVYLSFNDYFAQYAASPVVLSISRDGLTWNTVVDYSSYGTYQVTPNPNLNEIDISTWAANQPTVYLRFEFKGAYDLWWFVDDIMLYEPLQTDLVAYSIITDPRNGYTNIPLLQTGNLSLGGAVRNAGAATATGGTALFEIVNSATTLTEYAEILSVPTLAPGNTANITPTGPFILSGPGMYKSRITVTIAGDGNAANDLIESGEATISDTIFSRDDGANGGSFGIGAGPGANAMTGQSFNITSPAQLTSLTFFLTDAMNPNPSGSPVYGTIHPQIPGLSPDETTTIGLTDTLLIFPGTIQTGGSYYTLMLRGGPVSLAPGLYYAGMHEVDSLLTLGKTAGLLTNHAVAAYWVPDGWLFPDDVGYNFAYQLRMNFGNDLVGISETTSSKDISVYPNPSTGKIFISNNKSADNYSVNVFNSIGEKVYADKINNFANSMIDLSKQPAGIYHLQMISSMGIVNQSIVLSGK